jgi:hypothetical protein
LIETIENGICNGLNIAVLRKKENGFFMLEQLTHKENYEKRTAKAAGIVSAGV